MARDMQSYIMVSEDEPPMMISSAETPMTSPNSFLAEGIPVSSP